MRSKLNIKRACTTKDIIYWGVSAVVLVLTGNPVKAPTRKSAPGRVHGKKSPKIRP